MITHICNRCGSSVPVGKPCGCRTIYKKKYNTYGRDVRVEKFRKSKEWRVMRESIIARDGGLDQYVLNQTGEFVAGDSVHHIIPITEDWERRLDPSNLILLSVQTHSRIERAYLTNERSNMQRTLLGIVAERMNTGGD